MSGSWTSPLPLGLPTSYDYLGEPLTMADPPWTIGEHISGTILLNEKLPANLPLTDASYVLLDYSFEDGVQTWLPANSLVCEIRVATDGNGSIVDWKISLRQTPIQALGQPQQFLQSYNSVGDLVGEGLAGIGDCDSITATDYARSTNPGTWMQRANAVVTPIPTLSPLALALLGLVLIMVVGLPGTVALGKR